MTQKPVKAGPRATPGERNNRQDRFVDATEKALGSHPPAYNQGTY